MVGSLVIGLVDNYGTAYFPAVAYSILFIPVIIVLLVRPQGLLGPGGHMTGPGGLSLGALRLSQRFTGPVAGLAAAVVLILLLQGNGFIVHPGPGHARLRDRRHVPGLPRRLRRPDLARRRPGSSASAPTGSPSRRAHFYWPWAAVGIGLGVVLALGLALGIVAVRVKGVSFVIITLAMGQVLWGLAFQWVGLTEGDNGIAVPRCPASGRSTSTIRSPYG